MNRTLIGLAACAAGIWLSVTPWPVDAAERCSGQIVGASWYGPGFHGRTTANGERFDQNAMTAAHKTLPFGTRLRVTYRGKSATVRINDRGPYIAGRSIDLSKEAARRVGLIAPGHARVCIETL